MNTQKYRYFMSSGTEPKHEVSRKEFVKLLGESRHCVDQIKVVDGIYMDVANYDKAEREIRKAQRSNCNQIWACGKMTLYLDVDRNARRSVAKRRSRDSRFPD